MLLGGTLETNKLLPTLGDIRERAAAVATAATLTGRVPGARDGAELSSGAASRGSEPAGPSLSLLRWVSIGVPVAAVICVDLIVREILEGRLGTPASRVLGITTIALMGTSFAIVLFTVLGRIQRKLAERNRELAALNELGTLLGGPHDFAHAFDRPLDALLAITNAATAELLVLSPDHSHETIVIRRRTGADSPPSTGLGSEAAARPVGCAAIVLRVRDMHMGKLTLMAEPGRDLWLGASEHFLSSVARQFATAVHAANLFRDVHERNENSVALHRAGLLMHPLQNVEDVLNMVAAQAREFLGSTNAFAYIGDHDNPELASPRAEQSPLRLAREGGWAGHISAPLEIGGSVVGRICVCDGATAARGERGIELLEGLADLASAAINDCWRHERERRIAVLEERERISREMHDSLAQALGYLHLKARATADAVRRDPAAAEAALADMGEVAREAYADVREGILGLRESVSPDVDLASAIRAYANKFSRHSGVKTTVQVSGDELPAIGADVEVQLIRVVQEALTNTRKHAHAREVTIRLHQHDGVISVAVEDDGHGFDTRLLRDGDRQFGLRTMRERVERVGGRLTIESGVGRGTTVLALLPASGRGTNGSGTCSFN